MIDYTLHITSTGIPLVAATVALAVRAMSMSRAAQFLQRHNPKVYEYLVSTGNCLLIEADKDKFWEKCRGCHRCMCSASGVGAQGEGPSKKWRKR
uniref:Secreted protein n=1 Tax=Romanomermis culicivorax TaxID=13658 RepID=A0A915IIX0_ROMCU